MIHKKNIRKKGQIEIFGLAVIVILVSIGFFIFISIRSQEPKSNPQKEFTNDKIANDFVLSILETSVQGCEQYSVQDLIVDCARDKRIICNGNPDSCMVVNESVDYMLNKTFMGKYRFVFYSKGLEYTNPNTNVQSELFDISHMGCTQTSEKGQQGIAYIPLAPIRKTVTLNMNICY